jgi:hypothetical protein
MIELGIGNWELGIGNWAWGIVILLLLLRSSTSSPVPSVKFRLTQMPQNFLSDEDLVFLAISAKTRPTQS